MKLTNLNREKADYEVYIFCGYNFYNSRYRWNASFSYRITLERWSPTIRSHFISKSYGIPLSLWINFQRQSRETFFELIIADVGHQLRSQISCWYRQIMSIPFAQNVACASHRYYTLFFFISNRLVRGGGNWSEQCLKLVRQTSFWSINDILS